MPFVDVTLVNDGVALIVIAGVVPPLDDRLPLAVTLVTQSPAALARVVALDARTQSPEVNAVAPVPPSPTTTGVERPIDGVVPPVEVMPTPPVTLVTQSPLALANVVALDARTQSPDVNEIAPVPPWAIGSELSPCT